MAALAPVIDDELTLRRAQRGDERAWRELIATHSKAVHGLIWRMLAGGDRDRVEDLMQETFVRVLRGLPGFDPHGPAKLSTWILTIATRVVLNELRRPRLEPRDEPLSHASDPALARAIEKAVAALPADQRAVLVLRELHGFDYDEIAAATEAPLNTVKSRLSRARDALRAALGGTDD